MGEPVTFKGAYFKNLTSLTVGCVRLGEIDFGRHNTPALQELSLEQPMGDPAYFKLDCPELRSIQMEHVKSIDDGAGFGDSLSRCPKLETFHSYKTWGLGGGWRGTEEKRQELIKQDEEYCKRRA